MIEMASVLIGSMILMVIANIEVPSRAQIKEKEQLE